VNSGFQDFKISKTSRTSGDFKRIQGTSKISLDFNRLRGTSTDFKTLQWIYRDFKRFH